MPPPDPWKTAGVSLLIPFLRYTVFKVGNFFIGRFFRNCVISSVNVLELGATLQGKSAVAGFAEHHRGFTAHSFFKMHNFRGEMSNN